MFGDVWSRELLGCLVDRSYLSCTGLVRASGCARLGEGGLERTFVYVSDHSITSNCRGLTLDHPNVYDFSSSRVPLVDFVQI